MAQAPALVAADGMTPLRRILTSDIAGASMMSARSVLTGHPAEGLDPARLGAILRGAEDGSIIDYLELAEAMEEKDLHYAGVIGTRKRQVSQLPITVEAASDAELDQAKAQLIRDWLKRDTLEAEIFDILDAAGKGFSLVEIIWGLRHKPWLPERLEWRDPRWFEFDRVDGRTPLLRGNGAPQPLPPFKFICHTGANKSGVPIRGGLARPAAWAYLFKNFALKDWVSFAEVYGFPIRLGKYDAGATEEQIRTLMRAAASVSQDAAAVIPRSMELEFVSSNSNGSADLYERLCEYLDKQVSKLVLGQTATTDSEGGGLGGSGAQHNDVRGDIERADAKLLAATLNRDLVRPIIDLNFGRPADGSPALYPQINIGRENEEDVAGLIDAVTKLVPMGLKVATSVLRDKLGLPDPVDGEEVLAAPAPAALPAPPGAPGAAFPGLAAATRFSWPLMASHGHFEPGSAAAIAAAAAGAPIGDDIDELVALLADDGWEAVLGPIVDPLREALAGAASYDEAIAALAAALLKMDAGALAQRLERAAFAVRAAARAGADGQLTDG